MKKSIKRAVIVLAALLALLLILGALYVSDFYHADESAVQAAAQMSENVQTLQDGNVIYFVPKEPLAGLIFYPGGKVQAEAYAPLMQLYAENGILCALTKMPANLAVLNPNAADGIQERYPQIESWYIGGHSLGGAMAAAYVGKHADAFDSIILLAAYSTSDLSAAQPRALSIFGTEARILNRDTYKKEPSFHSRPIHHRFSIVSIVL